MVGQMLAAVLAALAPVAAPSPAHPAPIEQRLAFVVGDWTIAGLETKYRDDCHWFDSRSFVVCDTHDGRRDPAHHSIAALGWSAADNQFNYLQYDDSGRSRTERCFANDSAGLTCLGEKRGADGLAQTRTYIAPTTTGLALRQERSLNAGLWQEVGAVAYVRRKR